MSDTIWVPPSARAGAPAKVLDGEVADRLLGPDDAMFLPAKSWSYYSFEPGEDKHGRETVPSVHVDFERLRQRVIEGTATCDIYGVTAGWATHDGGMVPFPHPALYARLDDCHVYVLTGDAPDGWLDQVIAGAGFMFAFDPIPDGRVPWVVTDPIQHKYSPDKPFILPGTRRGPSKFGRNQPCPCESGLKFKRCCGA